MAFFSFSPKSPIVLYVLRMWAIAFVPTIPIAYCVTVNSPVRTQEDLPIGMVWFLLSVLFAPIVETLLLAFFLWLAGRVVHSVNALAILGGLVAAMGHSLVWLPWAFIIFWPFYVMSRTLLAWRPSGMAYALGVTTGIHVTYNLIPGIIALVFTGGGSGN